jgi:hypothetical protein
LLLVFLKRWNQANSAGTKTGPHGDDARQHAA